MSGRWSSSTRVIVFAVLLILTGLFINAIRPLIAPITIAALFAYALHPLVVGIERRTGMRQKWAVGIVYFVFLAITLAAPGTLVPLAIGQVQTLSSEFMQVLTSVERLIAEPIPIFGRTLSQEQWATFLSNVTESLTPAAEDALQIIETTSVSLLWIVVILVTTYYLLADWEGMRDWFIGLFPETEQSDLARLLAEIDESWRGYLRGTLTLMFIMGIFFVAVGLGIGLPGAVALGLFTGLLSMIPELGPTIAGVLSVSVALIEGSSFLPLSNFWFAVLVAAIYLVVMQLKSLWLRPLVMARFMHMNAGLVFVAIIGAALIFGILAALIVLPMIATVGQIGHYVRCKLLNLDPWHHVATEPTAIVAAPSGGEGESGDS
jgi:predicted PurR-regulated permease PerM